MSNAQAHNVGAFLKSQKAITPANSTGGAINGATVDRLKYNSAVLHVVAGSPSGTPDSFSVNAKVQESDDGSTWTDVTGAAITAITAAGGEAELDLDLTMRKKNVRAVVTPAFVGGTTPAVPVAATWTLGGAVELPA